MEKLTMSVEEMAQVVGISKPKAYELVHQEGFPVVRIGRRMVIPKEGLTKWLESQMAMG